MTHARSRRRRRRRAEDTQDDARQAREDTPAPKKGAKPSRTKALTSPEDSLARADELLIHPDDEPSAGADNPFGIPGPPVSRHSPFYVGFVGGLGVLLATPARPGRPARCESVLVLILVSMFLAVGLNPLVES